MLRSYVNSYGTDWDNHLVACEFAYNDSLNPSTNFTPFYLNSGRHPHTPPTLLADHATPSQPGNQSAQARLDGLRQDLLQARHNIAKAQEAQKTQADKHRRPAPSYSVGDRVMINSTHLHPPFFC